MSTATRARDIAREMALVLPRTVSGLNQSTGWVPTSRSGVRQFGEVFLDELVLTGFSLLGGNLPSDIRPLDGCAAAAEELSALGVDGAHADPEPLLIRTIKRRRVGGLAYERMTFRHEPELPNTLLAEGFGGPATAVVHLCRHTDGPRPWLVWVHGAGQGRAEDLLLSRIDRVHRKLGFNVAMPIQPGHGSRRHEWPQYPDMDPLGNVAGMIRVVSEVRAVVRWLRRQATAVVVAGISMGSPVAALVSHLEDDLDGVAVYTPILGLNSMIAHHLGRSGPSRTELRRLLGSPEVSAVTSVIDPLAVVPNPPRHRRLIVGAWHDRMAMREPALALQERWGGELYWYDGSHVGHVFSRRVQRVSERFLRGVAQDARA
ncbi:alpha/beta hydrolase [Mycobacterium intermedium]|uniref:Alpha/beta hydrolase n=1 Tax=Mycobacterium intermedium TaxID=28445 RepID=A0A1E3SLK4_MYCIE|nr:PHB depolymerase family esterase [Mycobacterium intermedium]MCV6964797.1 alpha/beta hydrolase [Mycobacterium intermedium]ODR03035.1 esterase [Mycobacterium intermedium]OPE45626.1 alpha/beta hydrolase [Mycobacterium intermedium]ORB02380.1 alpha/beta hydrolase [Mycobacterium intermedium]